MLLFSFLCAVLIGWLLGGRLSRFDRAGLEWLYLPAAALLLRLAFEKTYFVPYSSLLLFGSYLFIFVFLWHNRHLSISSFCLGLGSLCNLTVIAVNDFAMPVSAKAMEALSPEGAAALLSGQVPMYQVAGSSTRLAFLGDILWFPVPFFRGFASIGDIILAAGTFFLLMSIMGPTRLIRRGKREAVPAAARSRAKRRK